MSRMVSGNRIRSAVIAAAGLGMIFSSAAYAQTGTRLYPEHIYASSTLPAGSVYTYYPENVADGNIATTWTEGASGQGIGEYVGFVIPEGTVITGAKVYTGYGKSTQSFYENSAPTYLIFASGNASCGKWMSSYASNYDAFSDGCYFELDTPIVSTGSVRVEIGAVREGSVYQDTCISEIQLYGYTAGESQVVNLQGTNTAGTGISGLFEAGVDEESVRQMVSCANTIAKRKTRSAASISVTADELDSYDRAMTLYWYQYNCADERIAEKQDAAYGYIHTAAIADLEDMLEELFGELETIDEDMNVFLQNYTCEYNALTVSMYASGDFGDAGSWYLEDPYGVSNDGSKIVISGPVMQYNSSSGNYAAVGLYDISFDAQVSGNAGYGDIHAFQRLDIYIGGEFTGYSGYNGASYGGISDNRYQESFADDAEDFEDDDAEDYWDEDDDTDESAAYTEQELGIMAQDYYSAMNGYTPSCIGTMKQADGTIVIQLYDSFSDHNSTSAWYQVDAYGYGENIITGEAVDLANF